MEVLAQQYQHRLFSPSISTIMPMPLPQSQSSQTPSMSPQQGLPRPQFNGNATRPSQTTDNSAGAPLSGQKRDSAGNPVSNTAAADSDGGNFVKLFVGSVPRTITEDQVRPLFSEYGTVLEVALIKDKRTGQQQGCCFIKYGSREEAERAIHGLNNQKTLPGGTAPVQVRYADGERERLGAVEHKLFVGCLNRQATEKEIEEIFAPFGRVDDVYIMRDEQKQSRGCAFVKFPSREMAQEAINELNNTYIMRGCDQPLAVRFADPKRPKAGDTRVGGPGFGGPGFIPRPVLGLGGPRPTPGSAGPVPGHAPPIAWRPMAGVPGLRPASQNIAAPFLSAIVPRGLSPNGPVQLNVSGGPLNGISQGSFPSQSQHLGGLQTGQISGIIPQPQGYFQTPSQRQGPPFAQTGSIQHPQLQQIPYLQLTQTSQQQQPYVQQLLPSQHHVYPQAQSQLPQHQLQTQTSVLQPPLHSSQYPILQSQPQFSHSQTTQQYSHPQLPHQQYPSLQGSQQHFAPVQSAPMQQQALHLSQTQQSSQQSIGLQQLSQHTQPRSQQQQQQQQQPQMYSAVTLPQTLQQQPSWSHPAQPVPATSQTCNWTEHASPEGYKYYYNSVTGESKWEKPDELVKLEQQQQQQKQPSATTQPSTSVQQYSASVLVQHPVQVPSKQNSNHSHPLNGTAEQFRQQARTV